MVIPDEFVLFGRHFHQDVIKESGPVMERFIACALEGYPSSRRAGPTAEETRRAAVVKSFLDELLSGKYGEEELRRIWQRGTGGDFFLFDGKISPFLRMIRDALH